MTPVRSFVCIGVTPECQTLSVCFCFKNDLNMAVIMTVLKICYIVKVLFSS